MINLHDLRIALVAVRKIMGKVARRPCSPTLRDEERRRESGTGRVRSSRRSLTRLDRHRCPTCAPSAATLHPSRGPVALPERRREGAIWIRRPRGILSNPRSMFVRCRLPKKKADHTRGRIVATRRRRGQKGNKRVCGRKIDAGLSSSEHALFLGCGRVWTRREF